MLRFILIFLIILFVLAGLSLAGIPKMINYQGMLTDNSGTPLTGSYNLTFKIWTDTTGGSTLWTETQNGAQVQNGLFNVILGRLTALNLPFDQQYWLEVGVAGETMPRIRFTSVGYAFRAEKTDTANYALSGPWGSNNSWVFRITDTADTTLRVGGPWGLARYGNMLWGSKDSTHTNIGVACTTGQSGNNRKYCTVGGGFGNTATRDRSTVAGGEKNSASGWGATVGGGFSDTASGDDATIGGGYRNTASGHQATIGGGVDNIARETATSVGGGQYNHAYGEHATIGGGWTNTASGRLAVIGGGNNNNATDTGATVGGGHWGIASGKYATVPGGYSNEAKGVSSFAAGYRAEANHKGAFVWADMTESDFTSTGDNQFLIRASGGVGIGTNSPEGGLHVQNTTEGVIKVGTPTANGKATIIFEEGNDDAMALRYDGTANELRIDDEMQDTTRVVIERSGKVGIGITSPDAPLVIYGDGTSWNKGFLYIKNSNNDAGMRLYDRADSVKHHIYNNNDSGDKLRIAPEGSFTSGGITVEQTGEVGIGTTNPGTKLAVYGLTGTSSYNYVKVNTATGDFYYQTSSKRYKDDIQPLKDEFDKILHVEPKSFIDKASGQREIGYIAEEFDEMGLNNLVIYDKDGQPDGLKYELVSLYLLEVTKDQLEVIRELKAENEGLKKRVEVLEAK